MGRKKQYTATLIAGGTASLHSGLTSISSVTAAVADTNSFPNSELSCRDMPTAFDNQLRRWKACQRGITNCASFSDQNTLYSVVPKIDFLITSAWSNSPINYKGGSEKSVRLLNAGDTKLLLIMCQLTATCWKLLFLLIGWVLIYFVVSPSLLGLPEALIMQLADG